MIDPQILIVGAGPAGLSAAATLAREGIDNVHLVEREPEAGGIPRFCPHPTFGLTDFRRPMTGPAYAAAWRKRVDPAHIFTSTSVLRVHQDLQTDLATPNGLVTMAPRMVLLATGTREMSRAARLISGDRPRQIFTTGALQRMLTAGMPLPFRHPLVVGTELVSFSATLSLLEAGARPVAMIEEQERIVAHRPADLLTRLLLRVPVHCSMQLLNIQADPGDARILRSAIVVDASGRPREIHCDAIVFSGNFVPESSVLAETWPFQPPSANRVLINQNWQTGLPGLFAAGNLLRAVETSAWCAREGAAAALSMAALLRSRESHVARNVPIIVAPPVELCLPSAIAVPGSRPGPMHMQVKMAAAARGRFVLAADGNPFWSSQRINALPQRRIALTRDLPDLSDVAELHLTFEED